MNCQRLFSLIVFFACSFILHVYCIKLNDFDGRYKLIRLTDSKKNDLPVQPRILELAGQNRGKTIATQVLNLLIVRINASNKQSGDDDEIKIESNTFTMSRIPVPPRIEREERELADLLRGLRSIQRLSSDHIILKSKNYKAVLKKTNV